jgi:hypothetical protein
MQKRTFVSLGWLLAAALISEDFALAQCTPGAPSGQFQGTATSAQAGKLDISLNLSCTDGNYAGSMNTPLGVYSVTGGSFQGEHLKLVVAANDTTITLDAVLAGNVLQGSFSTGDDKGPFQLHRTGEAAAPSESTSEQRSLTAQQKRDDLKYLVKELTRRHPDAFANTSQQNFTAVVGELDHRLDGLNTDEFYIGLDHLANLIGDGHTYIKFPDDDANLPLDIRQFGNETRVVMVAPGSEKALGARVIAIENTPIEQARKLAASITPIAETDELDQARIDAFLSTGMALHGLGITPDRNTARYTLADDRGNTFVFAFNALPAGSPEPNWAHAWSQSPLSAKPVNGSAECTYLSDASTLYCNVRWIRDLAKPSREMVDILNREHPQKLVIDLRNNGGGDFNVGIKYLIEPIRKNTDINRKGHLFVLIGPITFSAAMSNAAQFRSMTEATLVGQPIGERPNSYQEPREFTLPNSHFVVRYSTRYYKFVDSGENRIVPDHEIPQTWNDYRQGRDPALDWALASK